MKGIILILGSILWFITVAVISVQGYHESRNQEAIKLIKKHPVATDLYNAMIINRYLGKHDIDLLKEYILIKEAQR